MGIGASIALICIGAIVAFGVRGPLPWLGWLDLDVVGGVMIIGGIAGLIVTLMFWANNRRQTHIIERHEVGSPHGPHGPHAPSGPPGPPGPPPASYQSGPGHQPQAGYQPPGPPPQGQPYR